MALKSCSYIFLHILSNAYSISQANFQNACNFFGVSTVLLLPVISFRKQTACHTCNISSVSTSTNTELSELLPLPTSAHSSAAQNTSSFAARYLMAAHERCILMLPFWVDRDAELAEVPVNALLPCRHKLYKLSGTSWSWDWWTDIRLVPSSGTLDSSLQPTSASFGYSCAQWMPKSKRWFATFLEIRLLLLQVLCLEQALVNADTSYIPSYAGPPYRVIAIFNIKIDANILLLQCKLILPVWIISRRTASCACWLTAEPLMCLSNQAMCLAK